MKRGKPPTRKTPLAPGAPPKRKSKVKPVNRERKASAYARNFGGEADAVRAMRCLVSRLFISMGWRGAMCCGDVQAAHVLEARKMGACGGDRFGLAPLCATHHPEAGERGTSQRAAFEARYGLDLDAEADRIALEHERPLGIRGLAERFAAEEAADLLVRDAGSEQGWTPCEPLDDHGREALLGWVHRRMHAYALGARASGVLWLPPDMAEWMAMDLFEDEDDGEATAFLLCEAAAERFGGWPS